MGQMTECHNQTEERYRNLTSRGWNYVLIFCFVHDLSFAIYLKFKFKKSWLIIINFLGYLELSFFLNI